MAYGKKSPMKKTYGKKSPMKKTYGKKKGPMKKGY
tara:strand:+ start:170 stop:274 length:105 start_codon:yes stop_codon:yes gene_type:complete